jgi:hypothetical protein
LPTRERAAGEPAIELELPDVTLCCIDTRLHALALRSLARSCRGIRFGKVVFLTDEVPPSVVVPDSVEVRRIEKIGSLRDYSAFVVKRLFEHVATSHVLVTQWDGYVVRPQAWQREFIDCDYIGAPWPKAAEGFRVGNGGFSLRSRQLLQALRDDRFVLTRHEDQEICGPFRPTLERDYGIRFASEELAEAFSFEMDPSRWLRGDAVFGFHGLFNLFLTEPQVEIAELSGQFPDDVLRSSFCGFLLSNCANYKQWNATIALGSRMLEADPDNTRTAELLTAARTFQASERLAKSSPSLSWPARVRALIRR